MSDQAPESDIHSPNLLEQTAGNTAYSKRYKKHVDVFTAIDDVFLSEDQHGVSREQAKRVLESVPVVFPEDWESQRGTTSQVHRLNDAQRKIFSDLLDLGRRIFPHDIETIIQSAVSFRKRSTPTLD